MIKEVKFVLEPIGTPSWSLSQFLKHEATNTITTT